MKNVVKSLDTAVALMSAGDTLSSQEITEAALEYIRHMGDREYIALKQIREKHPVIAHLISNIDTMLVKYPTLKVVEILPQLGSHYLYGDINDHINNMDKISKKLGELTQLLWKYNGANHESEKCYDWYPDEPKHPKKYSNVATSVLVSRGILSDKRDEDDHWNCQVLDRNVLLKLDPKQLRDEIEEASDLIAKITGAACNFLHIYPVKEAQYYEVLEKIGCIKVKEYFAFNAQVIDFDLAKLRKLKDENISMQEIWKLYKKADNSKPLFEQICKKQDSNNLNQLYNWPTSSIFSHFKNDNKGTEKNFEINRTSPSFERK